MSFSHVELTEKDSQREKRDERETEDMKVEKQVLEKRREHKGRRREVYG